MAAEALEVLPLREPRPFRIRPMDRNLWEELPPEARLWAAREAARQGFVLDEVIMGRRAAGLRGRSGRMTLAGTTAKH